MGRKRKQAAQALKPFCFFCDRVFVDEGECERGKACEEEKRETVAADARNVQQQRRAL